MGERENLRKTELGADRYAGGGAAKGLTGTMCAMCEKFALVRTR